VNLREADQIVSIAGTVGETLESNDAAQTGEEELDSTVVGRYCVLLDGLIVERWQSTAEDVDDAGIRLCSQVGLADQVLVPEMRLVAQAHTAEFAQGGEHAPVVLSTVRDKEVDVSVARTKRLAMTANPPTTTKRALSATIEVAATSSSGSSAAIGSLDGSQQARGLCGEVLTTPQQLAYRGAGQRSQESTLLGVQLRPSCTVAGLQQRVLRCRHHPDLIGLIGGPISGEDPLRRRLRGLGHSHERREGEVGGF
jgi:hypothetical protein